MREEDFDVRVYNYLKDKFPNHSLSDYEEASAFLTYTLTNEVTKWVNYNMKQATKRH